MPAVPRRVHPTWMRAKLERLDELLRQERAPAKAEIAKHLDGELTVRPLPSTGSRATGGDPRAGEAQQPPWKARSLFA
jgi:hypothetical protein